MNIRNVFDSLKKQASVPLTDEIANHIKELKKICDEDFYNQNFYGGAALNRKMLLDARIANNLTQDVILYLFTNDPTEETKIKRNSIGYTTLKEAIYYGMMQGLQVIKLLPNNERGYNPDQYAEQIRMFEINTVKILENIKKASGIQEIQPEHDMYQISLKDQFEHIVRTIELLKSQNKSDELLYVQAPTADLRKEVDLGFDWLCRELKIEDLSKETLENFCEKFLQNPAAILNGEVIHLFYDRAHIEAALEQDTIVKMGDKQYTYKDMFSVMVNKVAAQPDKYPSCTKEQFYLRLLLVENHLTEKFKAAFEEATLAPPIDVVADVPVTTEHDGLFAKSAKNARNHILVDTIKMYCSHHQEIALEFSNSTTAKIFAKHFKGIRLSAEEVKNNPNKTQFKTNLLFKVAKHYSNKPNHVFFMTHITGNLRLAINLSSTEKRDEFIKLLGIQMDTEVHHENGLCSQSAPNGIFTIYNGKSITGASPNTAIYFSPGLFLDEESINDFFIIENGSMTKEKYSHRAAVD